MPALQIRDLPVELYDSLKTLSTQNHRSLAKEATAAIEAYVGTPSRPEPQATIVPFPTACEPLATKRAAAIERIRSRTTLTLPPEYADAADLVRTIREERDAQLMQRLEDAQ